MKKNGIWSDIFDVAKAIVVAGVCVLVAGAIGLPVSSVVAEHAQEFKGFL